MQFVLPGMGATSGMFSGPWREIDNTAFLDWPTDSEAQSIEALASEVIRRFGIQAEDTVVGTSLGGIVACEISNQLKLNHLILIGGATNKDEINSLLRIFSPLVDLTPLSFIQQSAGTFPSDLTHMFSLSKRSE